MPASTLDLVNVALRASLSKNTVEDQLESKLVGSAKKTLLNNIDFEPVGSYGSMLDSIKSKYLLLKSSESSRASKPEAEMGAEECIKLPKYELYPMESIQLGWSQYGEWSPGCGMTNMGNTCYLNSTLQALFHVPALVNWLMSDKEHSSGCYESGGLCMICSVRKTLVDSQNASMNTIRPLSIYNKLRFICRNFIPGRQEDAHEFLRYLVEGMEKAYLSRVRNHDQLDPRIKETTPLNQIFGGYLRSAVHCLDCGHVSTTFQHFQDLLLDIRKAHTLEEALEGYFCREKLDDESYHCEACRKKVSATKQFSVERAPMVLCVQLKRFSVTNTKISKHISFRQRLDITKFARSRPSTPLVYKLVSLVTHMGPTVHCGHYTAVGLAPSGNFYQFDDSAVRPISQQGMLTTNAYILMYELESPPHSQRNSSMQKSLSMKPFPSSVTNGVGFTSNKVYGPELPPIAPINKTNTIVSNSNGKRPVSNEDDLNDVPDKHNKRLKIEENGSKSASTSNGENKTSNNCSTNNKLTLTKLVPYETEDSSNSEDSVQGPKNNTLEDGWDVSSTKQKSCEFTLAGKNWQKNKNQSNDTTVNELSKMSHSGYSAPVSTWNGTKSKLEEEVEIERREEKKKTINELSNTEDQGRTKHVKHHKHFKSNPGYNPIEEYHRSKNWNRNNGTRYYNKQFYNGNHKHRRNFHHKNYHNKNFRFRQ